MNRRTLLTMMALVCLLRPLRGFAQMQTEPLRNVGIDQKLGERLSLEARFRDESGAIILLGDLFDKRPVVLCFAAYQCKGLCTAELNDLTRAMNAMPIDAGKDFDVIAISFDARETSTLAADKRKQCLRAYRRDGAAAGVHFLTGDAGAIRVVTEAAGFRFTFDAAHDQFNHAGGIMIATPDGRLSRYLYGLDYSAKDLRLAIDIAAKGGIGPRSETSLIYCVNEASVAGKYTPLVARILKVSGAATALGVAGLIVCLRRRERGLPTYAA